MKNLRQLLSEYQADMIANPPLQTELVANDIFIIDAMNLFIRNFSVSTILDKRGHHIGGLVGSLNSLYAIIRKYRPTRLIIVFEGDDSTKRRKKLYKEYKANRKGKGVSNKAVFFDEAEAEESFNHQLFQFIQYLQHMPITLLSVPEFEADDIIGHIVTKSCLKTNTNRFTIVSTDGDYLQLVTDNVTIFSPIKKIMYQIDTVVKEFGIYPHNFLLYKTLIGDKSDNIIGIKGLQLKTLLKVFPDMSSEQQIVVSDLIQLCETKMLDKKCYKIYNEIHSSQDVINLNEQLMNLSNIPVPKITSREIDSNLLQTLELNLTQVVTYSEKQYLSEHLFKPPLEFFTEFHYLCSK